MQKREQYLLTAALVAVAVLVIGPRLKSWLIAPITERQNQLDAIEQRITKQSRETDMLLHAVGEVERWRGRSLPPDPLDAQRLYQVWLTNLASMSGLEKLEVTPGRRYTKSGVYNAVQVSLQAEGRLSEAMQFVDWFERTDLAHRFTSLTFESPASEGDPALRISLTAEGLALQDAPPRHELFAQTTLGTVLDASSAPQQMEVASGEGFPSEPGFRIRIDHEYFRVTKVDGKRWTVAGGVDQTVPAKHAVETVVEYAPSKGDETVPALDPSHRLLAANPFVKPAPVRPAAAPVAVAPPALLPPKRDDAAAMSLVGMINKGDRPQAWLHDQELRKSLYIGVGGAVEVGDVHAVVAAVHADHVLLEMDSQRWRLNLGETLRSLQPLPSETSESSPPPQDVETAP